MLDPFQCLLAVALAASLSAAVAALPGLWCGRPARVEKRCGRSARPERERECPAGPEKAGGTPAPQAAGVACSAGMAAGLAAGSYLLGLPLKWPPTSGLGRLLTIVLPATVCVELLSAFPSIPRWLAWCGRLAIALSAGRILLDGSVYLSGDHREWSQWQAALVLLCSGGLLALTWALLVGLVQRRDGPSIVAALAEAVCCASLVILMSGYLAGGKAALPVVGAVAGCLAVGSVRSLVARQWEGVVGVALVALFGLLYVGRFFGQLSTATALVVFLAPVLCWTSELGLLRCQPLWKLRLLRLALVAVPLAVIILLAKRDFERDMRPLLTSNRHMTDGDENAHRDPESLSGATSRLLRAFPNAGTPA
jgi:hypothetical protein